MIKAGTTAAHLCCSVNQYSSICAITGGITHHSCDKTLPAETLLAEIYFTAAVLFAPETKIVPIYPFKLSGVKQEILFCGMLCIPVFHLDCLFTK